MGSDDLVGIVRQPDRVGSSPLVCTGFSGGGCWAAARHRQCSLKLSVALDSADDAGAVFTQGSVGVVAVELAASVHPVHEVVAVAPLDDRHCLTRTDSWVSRCVVRR